MYLYLILSNMTYLLLRNFFIVIFCLSTCKIVAQKKELYLNDDLKQITQFEFTKSEKANFYNIKFELDTLIVNVKVKSIKKGKISNEILSSIKSEISTLSNKIIPDENILIINYYHGLDKCNSGGDKSYVRVKYTRYLKKLKKFENISQFFMYKSPEGIKKYGEKLNWIKDEFKTIEKIFLPIHYPCGSCVLIDKNGNYVTIKGEYDIERIIDMIKNEKETFDIDED